MNPNPAAGPDDSSLSRRLRQRRAETASAGVLAAGIAASVLACLALASGCSRPPQSYTPPSDTQKEKTDPWVLAARRLAKETDFSGCQSVLRGLNEQFRNDDSIPRPASMTAEQEKRIADVPLNPEDREEIQGWAFSLHDPAYLEQCLYLRDVAQSLRLPNLTPEQLADMAFAWVCRSVELTHSPLPVVDRGRRIAAALPPIYVLRRGSGTALERMYIYLALLQQLDLEGCLAGPPNAGNVSEANADGPDGKPLPGGPARPFWAVGVRLGSDVKLYDPWRAEPFPALWTALKAKPEAHQAWFEAPANRSGLKPDGVKTGNLYLAVPVNALSVRMAMLHDKLKDHPGVRLAVDPAALRAAFPDPKPAFWNSPDQFAYGRVLRTFLPRENGGTDGREPGARLYDLYRFVQVPAPEKPFLNRREFSAGDNRDVSERLHRIFHAIYATAFVEPPNPRERIQRGQFQVAMRDLISKQDMFQKELERVHAARDAEELIHLWCLELKQILDESSQIVLRDKEEQAAARAEADARISEFWKKSTAIPALLVSRVGAEVCQAETVFLLGLCKHEMAERAQFRSDHAAGDAARGKELKEQAASAWKEALAAWRTYEGYAEVQAHIPGRVEQVNLLKARAEKYAK